MKNATITPDQQLIYFNYGKLSVRVSSIKYAESIFGNYTLLNFVNRKQLLSSYTLGHFSTLLDQNKSFFIIRKGTLINLSFLKSAERRSDGLYAIMQDGSAFRVSRRKGKTVLDFLNG